MKEKQMLAKNKQSSVDYLYKVCKEHPLLVISTPHGVGKYHFNCIGYKNSQVLLEFILVSDHEFKDSDKGIIKIKEKINTGNLFIIDTC